LAYDAGPTSVNVAATTEFNAFSNSVSACII
jgi:hypothetical protein